MTILEDLAVTAEICGAAFSEAAARVLLVELESYSEDAIHGALARCRRELSGRLTLAAIIERLDDGRPGAEEAWAMLPKSEADSAVISRDMQAAMGPALELLASGDAVAARMAFLEVYRRRVAIARAEHEPVSWHLSLGHDAQGRALALIDAVERKRISVSQALLAAGSASEEVAAAINDRTLPAIEGPTADPNQVAELARSVAEAMPTMDTRAPTLGGKDFKEGDPLPGVEFIEEPSNVVSLEDRRR